MRLQRQWFLLECERYLLHYSLTWRNSQCWQQQCAHNHTSTVTVEVTDQSAAAPTATSQRVGIVRSRQRMFQQSGWVTLVTWWHYLLLSKASCVDTDLWYTLAIVKRDYSTVRKTTFASWKTASCSWYFILFLSFRTFIPLPSTQPAPSWVVTANRISALYVTSHISSSPVSEQSSDQSAGSVCSWTVAAVTQQQ